MLEFSSVSVHASEHAGLPERLNAMALEGWSVVSIVSTGSEVVAYLSRTKASNTSPVPVSSNTTPTPVPASDQNGWAAVGSSNVVSTPVTTAATSTPSVPADWYKDPAGRYEYRYWDGTKWTAHVSRGGVKYSDPPTP